MSANNNQAVAASLAQAKAAYEHLEAPLLTSVSGAAFREETDTTIMLLKALSAEEMGSDVLLLANSWKKVQQIVRLGLAKTVFSIGDKLYCNRSGVELEWDVIGIDHDTPSDPRFTHSLTLQLHDCFPTTLQFDAPEAFYYCHSALEAGTHHFAANGTNYQFTVTGDGIAAGSQLILNFTDNTPTSIFVSATVGGDFVKDTNGTDNLTIAVTAGSGGTPLNADYINDIDRVNKGSNNYKESAIRQWLNKSKVAGPVWTAQNNFDRPPTWYTDNNTAGFMNGMDADFLAVLGNVTKVTAVPDSNTTDTTTETFFLLSKSEVYGGLENGVDEGAPYPYYANYSNLSSAGTGADSNRIKYRNGTEPPTTQSWRIRSTNSTDSAYIYSVDESGGVANSYAYNNRGVAPACCII